MWELLFRSTNLYALNYLEEPTEEDHARPWTDVTIPELKACFWLPHTHGHTGSTSSRDLLVQERFVFTIQLGKCLHFGQVGQVFTFLDFKEYLQSVITQIRTNLTVSARF